LRSLLNQTFNDFEIIVFDSLSTDQTQVKVKQFKDKRIKFIRSNTLFNIPAGRNNALKYATGEYIFFTDGDCITANSWIEEGLTSLTNNRCIGVEGRTYYVSNNYRPTRSDDVIENINGGRFMTCNIAYKKDICTLTGGFDERLAYLEDRDFAFKARKFGTLVFNPKMVVYHQKKSMSPKQFMNTSKRLRNRIILYKRFNETPQIMGRIACPLSLMTLIFPPLVFTSLVRNRYRTKADFQLFPYIYFQLLCERLAFWSMCVKERVLFI
jgi:glycosyltransferase involved in cell wall biosynthesis